MGRIGRDITPQVGSQIMCIQYHMQQVAGSGSMTALLRDLTNSNHPNYTSDELLSVATACVGHVGPKLFDSFFCHVQRVARKELGLRIKRRYVIRLPN